jgi:hypothetical protein
VLEYEIKGLEGCVAATKAGRRDACPVGDATSGIRAVWRCRIQDRFGDLEAMLLPAPVKSLCAIT